MTTPQDAACVATTGPTVAFQVHFRAGGRGRRRLRHGPRPEAPEAETGRIPRISRLMALAIKFEGMLHRGEVRDHADLARLGGVSRARIGQVMDLLNLAPDVQEAILCSPRVLHRRDLVTERTLRMVVEEVDWARQRDAWRGIPGEGVQQRHTGSPTQRSGQGASRLVTRT